MNTSIVLPLAGAGLVTAAAVAVAIVSSIRARKLREEMENTRAELARAEAQHREQTRYALRLRTEQRGLTNLVRFLPNLVRELNQSDLDPRRIPTLLFQLTEAIFEPEQMLLYATRSPGDDLHPPELYLREQRGLAEVPAALKRVRVGEGKIGWVAENRVEMADRGLAQPDAHRGAQRRGQPPRAQARAAGPARAARRRGRAPAGRAVRRGRRSPARATRS